MSITLVEAWREKQRGKWIVKFLLRRVAHPCVLVVLAYVFPKMAIFYAICGLYDVSRNRVNVTTLRRLYNLNEMTDDSAYIVVGDTTNRWRDNKLFIFDDTLMHESINQTDQARYCLFVDMIRPTPFPAVMRATVYVPRLLTESFKFVYYQNWKVIQ